MNWLLKHFGFPITKTVSEETKKTHAPKTQPGTGVPFSFQPASLDIHRAIQEETKNKKDSCCARCRRVLYGSHYAIWFERNFRLYSCLFLIARSDEEARKKAEELMQSGGVIGISEEHEELRAIPGVKISSIIRVCEAYENELDDSSIPF